MSLHAELSAEAQAALASQKMKSTISSLIISVLAFVLVILILMIIALKIDSKVTPDLISYKPAGVEDSTVEQPKIQEQVVRKPSTPANSMAKVIASASNSRTAIPVPDIQVTEPSVEFGNGDDFGEGWVDEAFDSSGFGNIPASMKKRCSKDDRLERLKKSGGNEACEEAVVKSLKYFQKTQKSDGSWEGRHRVGYTGLALLCYLGHCETPVSAEFGETVEKAILYLVKVGMSNKGRLGTDLKDRQWCYEHAIATYALAEAYTLCNQLDFDLPNLKNVVEMAGKYIMKRQHENGGWSYGYATTAGHVDTSLTCWHLQALKACKYTKIRTFDNRVTTSANKGLKYLEACQAKSGGVYYSLKAKHLPTMTGATLLCYQQWGKKSHPVARLALTYFKKNVTFNYNNKHGELYSHYYYGQAIINVGGPEWTRYNKKFRNGLLRAQKPDGSYKKPGGKEKIIGFNMAYLNNVHYRTCLATLMLEVYYRFLPGSSS